MEISRGYLFKHFSFTTSTRRVTFQKHFSSACCLHKQCRRFNQRVVFGRGLMFSPGDSLKKVLLSLKRVEEAASCKHHL